MRSFKKTSQHAKLGIATKSSLSLFIRGMTGFFDILRLNCKLLLIFPSWNKSQVNKSVRLTLFSWQLYHNDTLSRTWNDFFLNVKCNFDRSKVTWKTGTKMFDKQYKFTVISTFMVYSWNGYRGWYTRFHTLYSAKNILLAFDCY